MLCLRGCAPFSGLGTFGLASAYCSPIEAAVSAAAPTTALTVSVPTIAVDPNAAAPVAPAASMPVRIRRPTVSAMLKAPGNHDRNIGEDQASVRRHHAAQAR